MIIGQKAEKTEKGAIHNYVVTISDDKGKVVRKTRVVQYYAPDKAERNTVRMTQAYDSSFTVKEGWDVTAVETDKDGNPLVPEAPVQGVKVAKAADRK